MAYNSRRKVVTLEGIVQLRIVICQCHTPTCPQYHVRYRPEEEGGFALPHGEFGLDVIALIGAWRFREHRSGPEMHQRLQARGQVILAPHFYDVNTDDTPGLTSHIGMRRQASHRTRQSGLALWREDDPHDE